MNSSSRVDLSTLYKEEPSSVLKLHQLNKSTNAVF